MLLRIRRLHVVVLAIVIGLSAAVAPVQASVDVAGDGQVAAHVIVRVDPASAAPLAGELIRGDWRAVPIAPGADADRVLRGVLATPGVMEAYLEPVYELAGSLGEGDPADPLFWEQWHLHQIGLPDAWRHSTGTGVVVAVIDTGVSRGPDLRCRALAGEYDAVMDVAGPGTAEDRNGHGTHIAGTIAQCTDNGMGGAGVAPNAGILAVRAMDDDGMAGERVLARAIDWAVAKGADVINLSLGRPCDSPWPACGTALLDDVIERAVARGVVIVASTGNEGADHASYPASHPDVIGVGATTRQRTLAAYTNTGPGLSVVAPGGMFVTGSDGVMEAVLQETLSGPSQFGYAYMVGTSMAAPHVAGVVALMRSVAPEMSPADLRDVLEATATDLGPSGFDPSFGHGEIHAVSALDALLQKLAVASVSFVDVPTTSMFHDDIVWLAAAGITTGCNPPTNDQFCPTGPVTRGQMAAFMVRALELTETSGATFTDVPSGSTFATDIDKLVTAGITTGCNPPSNDRYCPTDPVTRGQMAAFMSRGWALQEQSGATFTDVAAGSVFAADIDRLATAGITTGCNPPGNDRFCPTDPVTRGQMAAFVHRIAG